MKETFKDINNMNITKDEKDKGMDELKELTFSVSMADKAQMINALTNTMDVNRSRLGRHDRLQTISLEKLTKLIESIDIRY